MDDFDDIMTLQFPSVAVHDCRYACDISVGSIWIGKPLLCKDISDMLQYILHVQNVNQLY